MRSNRRKGIVTIPRRTMANKVFVKLRFIFLPKIVSVGSPQPATTCYEFASGNNPCIPDPQNPSTGEPTGFDQWCQFYQKYTCFASKIKIHVQSQTTNGTSSNMWRVGLLPTNQGGGGLFGVQQQFTDRSAWNIPYCRQGILGNSYDKSICTLKGFCKTKALWPNKDLEDEALFSGNTGSGTNTKSNPGNLWSWWIAFAPYSTVAGANTQVGYHAEITYYLMFSDPTVLTAS